MSWVVGAATEIAARFKRRSVSVSQCRGSCVECKVTDVKLISDIIQDHFNKEPKVCESPETVSPATDVHHPFFQAVRSLDRYRPPVLAGDSMIKWTNGEWLKRDDVVKFACACARYYERHAWELRHLNKAVEAHIEAAAKAETKMAEDAKTIADLKDQLETATHDTEVWRKQWATCEKHRMELLDQLKATTADKEIWKKHFERSDETRRKDLDQLLFERKTNEASRRNDDNTICNQRRDLDSAERKIAELQDMYTRAQADIRELEQAGPSIDQMVHVVSLQQRITELGKERDDLAIRLSELHAKHLSVIKDNNHLYAKSVYFEQTLKDLTDRLIQAKTVLEKSHV